MIVFDRLLVAPDEDYFEATAASSWLMLDLSERPVVYLVADGFEATAAFLVPTSLFLPERVLVMASRF